jgi:superfamily II DNA or RNA helicase
MEPYKWQEEAVEKLLNNRSLLVKAPPGSGKSLIAGIASKAVPNSKTIVICHSIGMVDQWKSYGLNAINIHRAIKYGNLSATLVVLDECQHYESEVWSKIYDIIKYEFLLGLSATPMSWEDLFK